MSTTSGSSPASITSPIDTGDDYFDKGNTSEQSKLPDEETSKDKGNQNGEELDFEEEDNESLEEGEEESDGDEGLTNENNEDRNSGTVGDSKDVDIKEVQSKSRKKDEDEEDEDGEVNSEEELEEGEVKEDDDSETGGVDDETNGQKKPIKKTGNLTSNSNNQAKTSICRFFAKGQCTWGLNCRFLHLAAPVVALPIKLPNQRGFPYQVGLNPTGLHPTGMHPTGIHPTGAHPSGPLNVAHTTGAHPTGHHSIPRPPLNRHQAAALAGTTIHPPHPPSSSQSSSSNTDAAWVRGLRNAKEMLVKANKRKEEESDFEKRFNAAAEDEATSHSKHSHHSRESPESGDYGDRRSPHSYHAREREKRSHREGNRRDETRDSREARDVREREPRETRDRDNREREPRDEYWNSEYERRRRLAFESAPWNDEQSPPPAPTRGNARPREAAEMYRDPWRRSKSPPAKWSGGRRTDVSTASKRSHSLSSISGSESGSELSGSESMSGSSFSGSDVSYSDASEASGRSPREGRLKSKSGKSRSHKDKTRSNPDQSGHHTSTRDRSGTSGQPPKGAQAREKMSSVHVSKNRSNRSSIDEEASGSGPRKKSGPVPAAAPISKPRRDSWSDSDSGSMSQSDSSLYSGSESGESDAFSGASDTPLEDDRRTKGYRNRRDAKPHPSSTRQTYDSVRRAPQRSRTSDSPPPPPPPSSSSHHSSNPKRMKMSTSASTSSSSIRENNSMKNRHSSTMPSDDLPTSSPQQVSKKSLHTPTSPNDGPKKNPIKMTFKKKHSNLRTDRVITAKLSGGKSDEESGEEEELNPVSGDQHQQISPSPRADADDFDAEDDETDEHDNPRISKKMNDPLIDRNHSDNDGDNFEIEEEEYENENEDDDIDDVSLHQKDKRKPIQRISNSSCKSEKSSTIISTPSTSSSPSSTKYSKDGSSRREHLLKQLEAVEAMIAKKKAKLQ